MSILARRILKKKFSRRGERESQREGNAQRVFVFICVPWFRTFKKDTSSGNQSSQSNNF